MSIKSVVLALLCVGLVSSAAQSQNASVQIKVALIDSNLNVKPVPKFKLKIEGNGTSIEAATGFDGIAEVQLPAGQYKIHSVDPARLDGKLFSWDIPFAVSDTAKSAELSNDNASVTDGPKAKVVDDLVEAFKKYRASVVTIWAEIGPAKGTGFFVDKAGLILTNQHVVGTSEFIAVQLDDSRLLRAKVLAADSEKDVAVLKVNLEHVSEVTIAPLIEEIDPLTQEGERVFTIGNPIHQQKVMTTGIVSKVEKTAIISDVNINHGNSGGPLFDSNGKVIGITTFGDITRQGGPGISGIVRIEEAKHLLDAARAKLDDKSILTAEFLPNFPTDTYPLDAIKASAQVEKFKSDPYIFGVGDYDVAFVTPILRYRYLSAEVRAGKEKEKRNRKSAAAVQGTFEPLQNVRGWEQYIGEYEPVLIIQATPKLKEGFWSAFGRGMAASHGYAPGPASLHFKTDFYRMKLFCGTNEITPLFPGKGEYILDEHNSAVNITDATYSGVYKYSADAITDKCGKVTLQLISEKNPNDPKIKELEPKTVEAVVRDFQPYLLTHTTEVAKH